MALLVCAPLEMEGSVLGFGHQLLNNDCKNVFSLAAGTMNLDAPCVPCGTDGLVDSLRFLAAHTNPASRRLLRLLVATDCG